MGNQFIRRNSYGVGKDFYPTPPVAVYSLLQLGLIDPGKIWEPAAGEGWISKELQRNGFAVYSSDIMKYDPCLVPLDAVESFLTMEPPSDVSTIITNPPFMDALPEKFVRRSLDIDHVDTIAMFCRLTFLESKARYKLFQKSPPNFVYVFSDRLLCDKNKLMDHPIGGMASYAWFVWKKEWKTEGTQVFWIDTKKRFKEWKTIIKDTSYENEIRDFLSKTKRQEIMSTIPLSWSTTEE